MYIICVYDVEEKRCNKVMKLLRKYMFHVQNSVFEGELTPSKFKEVKMNLNKIIQSDDSVLFYYVYENKKINKEGLGKEVESFNIII
jgi:CRISPR-associated protein Cas2